MYSCNGAWGVANLLMGVLSMDVVVLMTCNNKYNRGYGGNWRIAEVWVLEQLLDFGGAVYAYEIAQRAMRVS